MRVSMMVAVVALAATTVGASERAGAQSVEAFLAGTSKDCPSCNLAGAKLKRRNLAGADLSGANLAGASFHRSSLPRYDCADAIANREGLANDCCFRWRAAFICQLGK